MSGCSEAAEDDCEGPRGPCCCPRELRMVRVLPLGFSCVLNEGTLPTVRSFVAVVVFLFFVGLGTSLAVQITNEVLQAPLGAAPCDQESPRAREPSAKGTKDAKNRRGLD